MEKLCQILRLFVFTNQLLQSFILSQKATRIGWRKKQGLGWWTIHYNSKECCLAETVNRDSSNRCRRIVWSVASQLDFRSTCQATPAVLYTEWELNSEHVKIKPRQNKTRKIGNMVMSYLQRVKPQCRVEICKRQTHIKINIWSVEGYCGPCITVFEAVGNTYFYCPCQNDRYLLTDEQLQQGIKTRELDDLEKSYIYKKNVTTFCRFAIVIVKK